MALAIDELKRLRAYCDALITASAVLDEAPPEPVDAVVPDLVAWKTSQRNRILAGSGDKAAVLGTLSTAPTITESDFTKLDLYPSAAVDLIAMRDSIRARAFALTETKPTELKP